ncbi:glutamate receptor 1.4-like [Gossypium australe]|uniref:Glutamate receptor 1.4-like n=1 Tax=Gossypium australe TaxID=47621 RepID=A0A5B6UKC4_9ROSI|nr:glutamate receptor 1.4-like [Gossypium australe]
MLLFFAFYFSLLGELSGQVGGLRPAGGGEVGVGLIVDTGSREGKLIYSFVSMAISDFNSFRRDNQMKIALHTIDSKGNPLHSSSDAYNLLEKAKVKVILISAQKSTLDTKVLAEFGNQTKIPVISVSSSTIDDDLNTILWPGGTSTIPKAVFEAAIAGLKYQASYEFIPFEYNNPNIGEAYNDLIYQVYLQKYDGAVGDITINANRSLYVDFTLPFTDIGVGMVTRLTPKDNQNLWIFLKPLTPGLWLTIVGAYVLATFVIWLIERPALAEQQTQQSNGQIGRMISFSFSILVFAQWEKLTNNLSRSVVVLWVFEMFIVGSNYTATLTSMLTVQHIEFISKVDNIGHRLGPVTQEVVGILNIQNSSSTSKWLTSPAEFERALSEGSKNGGFSAIIDEMPYINVFLEKYSAHYSMVGPVNRTTNGFGFVFPKGSTLARDISMEIAKLREDGRLEMLENVWFKSSFTNFDSRDTLNSVNPLTISDFRGLFFFTGTFSALAVLLFFASLLRKNFYIMNKWGQPKIVKQYVCMKIFKNGRDANVIHPEFDNL